jgi:hypothetical protein
MYDPTIGRWLTEDPESFAAGDANLYRYVHNNATNATDPTGLEDVVIRTVPKTDAELDAEELARLKKAETARQQRIQARQAAAARQEYEAEMITLRIQVQAANAEIYKLQNLVPDKDKEEIAYYSSSDLLISKAFSRAIREGKEDSPDASWVRHAQFVARSTVFDVRDYTSRLFELRQVPGKPQDEDRIVRQFKEIEKYHERFVDTAQLLVAAGMLLETIQPGPSEGEGVTLGELSELIFGNARTVTRGASKVSLEDFLQIAKERNAARAAVNAEEEGLVGMAKMTQWGWERSPSWYEAVKEIASGGPGGVIRTVKGKVPTYEEAVALIEKAGGTIQRVEGPHAAGGVAGHIDFTHINWTTAGGTRSHLAIEALPTTP